MDNFYDQYKRKISIRGKNPYERNMKHKIRTFNSYFNNTLNNEMVILNQDKRIPIVFQDHSQSNNKDLSDDKYVIAKNENHIDVGDYLYWRDHMWMIFTKEFKTIPTHQQAKVKETNEIIKWIRDGKIVNNGIGWWAYVKSNTLYTMGVSETPYIHVPDAKMMMYMQNNDDTRQLKMNERIFVGSNVYKIKFIDDVSREGLISYLLDQDTIHSNYDNVELRVADYYKYFGKGTDFDKDTDDGNENPNIDNHIVGKSTLKVDGNNEYISDIPIKEWSIESIDNTSKYISIVNSDDNNLKISCANNPRMIGHNFNIIAKDYDDNYYSFNISIIKKY